MSYLTVERKGAGHHNNAQKPLYMCKDLEYNEKHSWVTCYYLYMYTVATQNIQWNESLRIFQQHSVGYEKGGRWNDLIYLLWIKKQVDSIGQYMDYFFQGPKRWITYHPPYPFSAQVILHTMASTGMTCTVSLPIKICLIQEGMLPIYFRLWCIWANCYSQYKPLVCSGHAMTSALKIIMNEQVQECTWNKTVIIATTVHPKIQAIVFKSFYSWYDY